MKKQILMMCFSCFAALHIFAQPLFTYGSNEVSKDEFVRAFSKNMLQADDRAKAMKEYLELYSKFKLKVKTAKEMKLDTVSQLRYDMMNYKKRLESDYKFDMQEAVERTAYKRNPAIKDEMLFRFADSATIMMEKRKFPIGKETFCTMTGTVVKVEEWLDFARSIKLDPEKYKGESNSELLDMFVNNTVTGFYRKHLEELNPDIRYQMQEFKEGNLMFEVMGKKIWNKSSADDAALKSFYEKYKDHFVWVQSADVILVNARFYAYADFASENMKKGEDWMKIAENSEGMIMADSGRYEISQLPIKPGTKLVEGAILDIVKNEQDNGAGFVKIIKIHPPKLQRSFDEARSLVVNEYQKQLEESWMGEMEKKYPVKINQAVFQALLSK